MFEAIRQTGSWAGYYEVNTIDRNGIVGPHPEWTNLVFANGFSGHGIQQSPAVGRGVADLLLLAVEAAALGEAARWKTSRGGQLFPHLYGPLPTAMALSADPLPLGADGLHRFPALA